MEEDIFGSLPPRLIVDMHGTSLYFYLLFLQFPFCPPTLLASITRIEDDTN